MEKKKVVIIIGSGLTAVTGAIFAKKKWQDSDVVLVNSSEVFGGNLQGYQYDENLYFDMGTHIFQESGFRSIDELLKSVVPSDDLIVFPPGRGDFTGGLYATGLQTDTNFPIVETDDVYQGIESWVSKLSSVPPIDRRRSAWDVAVSRFGEEFTATRLKPILESMFHMPIKELSSFVLAMCGLSRVAASSMDRWESARDDDIWRAIMGVPNQRLLPKELAHTRKSFYARNGGTRAFIDGLLTEAGFLGVNIISGVKDICIDIENKVLSFHSLENGESQIDFCMVFSALGVVGTAKLLNVDLQSFDLQKGMPHTICNFKFSKPSMRSCFYYYGYESAASIYRVTDYDAFALNTESTCRLTVEVLGDVDEEKIVPDILTELESVGLIEPDSCEFSAVERLPMGFPSPSTKNFRAMDKLAGQIEESMPEFIKLGGAGFGGGRFFQNEVVPHMYQMIESA